MPLTETRRIGAAWDTAQNSVLVWQPWPPAVLMVRLDSDRQKLSSAMQLFAAKHWLYTSAEPLMTTSPVDGRVRVAGSSPRSTGRGRSESRAAGGGQGRSRQAGRRERRAKAGSGRQASAGRPAGPGPRPRRRHRRSSLLSHVPGQASSAPGSCQGPPFSAGWEAGAGLRPSARRSRSETPQALPGPGARAIRVHPGAQNGPAGPPVPSQARGIAGARVRPG